MTSPPLPIGRPFTKPTPLVIPGSVVVSPEGAELAPKQPATGGLYS